MMRFHLPIVLTATLAMGIPANARDVATVNKRAKDTGHATPKGVQGTAHGPTQAVQKASSVTARVMKKTRYGIKKWAKSGPWNYGQ